MGMVAVFRLIDSAELDRLIELQADQRAEALAIEVDPDIEIDVDKSWDGIHYLFTGHSSSGISWLSPLALVGRMLGRQPASFARTEDIPSVLSELMAGGEELSGSIDDGITSYFDVEKTQALSEALSAVTNERLIANFDGQAMSRAGVYLSEFWKRDRQIAIDYLTDNLDRLRAFFSRAASEKKAVLRIMC